MEPTEFNVIFDNEGNVSFKMTPDQWLELQEILANYLNSLPSGKETPFEQELALIVFADEEDDEENEDDDDDEDEEEDEDDEDEEDEDEVTS